MAAPLTLEPSADDTRYQAQAQQYLDEMARLRDQMESSRREMEQSRRERGSLLAQIEAIFSEKKG